METVVTSELIFAPLVNCLTPEVAARIVNIKLDDAVQKQANEWAELASEGKLTPEDRLEYQKLIDRVDTLDTMKALARQALNLQQ